MALDFRTQNCRTQQFVDDGDGITQYDMELCLERCISESMPCISQSIPSMIHEILRTMISNIYSRVNVNISKKCIIKRLRDEIYVYEQFVSKIYDGRYLRSKFSLMDICIALSLYKTIILFGLDAFVTRGGGFNDEFYVKLGTSTLQERMDFLILGG